MNKKLLKQKIIEKYDSVANFSKEIDMPTHYVYEVIEAVSNLNNTKCKPSTIEKVVAPFGYKVKVSVVKIRKPKRKKKKEQKWTN